MPPCWLLRRPLHIPSDSSEKIPLWLITITNEYVHQTIEFWTIWLSDVLRPLWSNRYSVHNSSEFKELIQSQPVYAGEEIFSFDVVLLFISIPIKLVLQVVDCQLQSNGHWHKTRNLTHKQLISLIDFVLINSYFVFEEFHSSDIWVCNVKSPVDNYGTY